MMNKSEWKKVRLGDITIQIRGVTYKKSDVCEKEIENFIPLLRANNIKDSKIIYNDVVFVNQNNVSENQILRKNDILICTSSGSLDLVGKAGQINKNENISFGAFCKVIRILDENRLNPLYLNYFFQSSYYKQNIKKIAQGANINNLKNGDIDNLEIILYSLEKQKYIGNILNNLSNILNKRKEQLFELEKLVKFQFLKMFGDPILNEKNWKIEKLENVYKIIDGDRGKNYPKQNEFYKNEFCLFLNAKNVTNYGFNFDKVEFITKEKDEILRSGKLERGDIVVTTRGTIGNTAFYDNDVIFENIRINSGMIILREKEKINPIFFIKYFQNFKIYNQLVSGTAQPQIPITNIKNLKIILPAIELQNKFAEFVKQVDKSKFVIPSKILGGVA